MPLPRAAAAVRRKIEEGQQEQLEQRIPAGRLRDQIPSANLGPQGNTGSGYTPAPHTTDWADVTGTPTTLSGYGITDAYTKTASDARYAPIAIVGTVTSVALTAPAELSVAGSPLTTSGTLALSWATKAANIVFAGPSSGGAATPTFRALVAADLPATAVTAASYGAAASVATFTVDAAGRLTAAATVAIALAASAITSGQLLLARGGTGVDLSATGGANQIVRQNSAGGAFTVSTLAAADIPSLDSAKITTGEIPRSPLTTRGDVLTRDATTHTRVAIGASGRYMRSDGTDPSWHTLDWADLVYSGLTTGQVPRATGITTVAFGALDLANSSAVTGLVGPGNGGTGVNNGSFNLTVPATGTAALLARAQTFSATQTIAATLDAQQITRVRATSGTTGYGIRIWDGTTDYGNFQSLDLGGVSYMFFSSNRQYDGTAWQLLNSRVGGNLQISGDAFAFYTFASGSTTPVSRFDVDNAGNTNTGATFKVAGTQVLGTRKTGWSAWTGTPTRSSKATSTATLANVAEALKALLDDLISHGVIGA